MMRMQVKIYKSLLQTKKDFVITQLSSAQN